MKYFLIICSVFFYSQTLTAQTFLDENFDNGIPATFTLNNGGDSQQETWLGVSSYVEAGTPKTLNGTPFLFCNEIMYNH